MKILLFGKKDGTHRLKLNNNTKGKVFKINAFNKSIGNSKKSHG